MEFVVRLPADNVGILGEMPGDSAGDAFGLRAKSGIRRAAMLPAAMHHAPTILIHAHPLRLLHGEPARRAGGGGAKNGRNAPFAQSFDGLIEQGKIEFSRFRFHQIPGKFRHAHDVHPSLHHTVGVVLPVLGAPMFRIIGCAKQEFLQILPDVDDGAARGS